jgi:hypothetical protein
LELLWSLVLGAWCFAAFPYSFSLSNSFAWIPSNPPLLKIATTSFGFSSGAAVVVGLWRLVRPSDKPHGIFTLLFRRTPAGWRIVHDHTS